MAIVLVISSQVARGYVGGSTTRLVLERLGHEVRLIPTILLSNHPGHPHCARHELPADQIRETMLAFDGNEWLFNIDAVMTGYLPTAEHVSEAVKAVAMVQCVRNDVRVFCDPILGDDPDGLYIGEDAAVALRDGVLPLAEIATPNRFELEWLTGTPVAGVGDAARAARKLRETVVLASGVPGDGAGTVCDAIVFSDAVVWAEHRRRDAVPHGTGDLLAALYTGHLLNGHPPTVSFARAAGGIEASLAGHRGADDLPLPLLQSCWAGARPVRTEEFIP